MQHQSVYLSAPNQLIIELDPCVVIGWMDGMCGFSSSASPTYPASIH